MVDKKKILILGIGNLLFKDEGVGIQIAEKMKNMNLPPDVEVVEGGTVVSALPYIIEKRDKVIVVDAMKAGGSPGTIYRLSEKEFLETRTGLRTTQESEFEDALRMTMVMKTNPKELVVIGIEPEDMGERDLKLNMELSPTLQKKVPEIIEAVMKEIGK
ncbi:MAG: hydrogenase maturation protease [Nitrospirota bacterium]